MPVASDLRRALLSCKRLIGRGICEFVENRISARNIRISPSEVAYLGRKFVVYLALAHRQAAPRIKKAMLKRGGYVLHLERTQYLDLLLNGLPSLEDRFAQMDIATVRRELHAANQSPYRIPVKIRNVINCVAFPDIVSNLLRN